MFPLYSLHVLLLCALLCAPVAEAYDYNYCGAPPQLSITNTNYELQFVQVITRHGDRSTLTQLPGDHHVWQCNLTTLFAPTLDQAPNVNIQRLYRKNYLPGREPTPGNCYSGQLTVRGFAQHFELGQNLRSLYVEKYQFLPPTLNASLMSIRSTDIPRTLASAQGNSIGMYPPSSVSGNDVPVIDIFTMDSTYEDMYPNTQLCPAANDLMNKVTSEPAYVAYMNSQIPLQQNLSNILGIPLASLPDWAGLLDAFQVMTCYGQTYPGLTQDLIEQVFAVANWQWNYTLNNTELVALQIGQFTTELVANIQAFVKGEDIPKYLVFSGHDTTIGPLLASLQGYDGQWPPYASHVEIELWNDNSGNYYVQVKYQGTPLVLPVCEVALCPIAQFIKLVTPVISINYQKACSS